MQHDVSISGNSFMNNLADFDDDLCNMDNFEEHEQQVDKPHESVAAQRDTPIKRNALASK